MATRVRRSTSPQVALLAVVIAVAVACAPAEPRPMKVLSPSQPADWLFFGDSITHRAVTGDLGLNRGVDGWTAADALAHIDEALNGFGGRYVVIAFGSNDVIATDSVTYLATYRDLIKRIERAGLIPVVPTIPYSTLPSRSRIRLFNAALARLDVVRGPDLYTFFRSHPGLLGDGLHPNAEGISYYDALWLETERGRQVDWPADPVTQALVGLPDVIFDQLIAVVSIIGFVLLFVLGFVASILVTMWKRKDARV